MVPFRYQRWPPSWNSSNDISSQTISQIEPKVNGMHRSDKRFRIAIFFRSDIQDSSHGSYLEILQTTSPKPWVGLSRNLIGGVGAIQRFRIAKIFPFRYPRWSPGRPSWNSSNEIFSQIKSRIEPKLDGRHRRHKDSELLIRSVPISKMAASWNSSKDISSQTVSRIKPILDGKHRSDIAIQHCSKSFCSLI